MSFSLEILAEMIAGLGLLVLHRSRKENLRKLRREQFPELDPPAFFELLKELNTAYERLLYLAWAFLATAGIGITRQPFTLKLLGYGTILFLFLSNLIPRNRIMRILHAHEIHRTTLLERGIRL